MSGHDGVQAERGPIIRDWILQVCNTISVLEEVPVSLKMESSPLCTKAVAKIHFTHNFRGVTVTSVFAKVLESLLLPRLQCHLANRGIPHTNQTAYRKGLMCGGNLFYLGGTINLLG